MRITSLNGRSAVCCRSVESQKLSCVHERAALLLVVMFPRQPHRFASDDDYIRFGREPFIIWCQLIYVFTACERAHRRLWTLMWFPTPVSSCLYRNKQPLCARWTRRRRLGVSNICGVVVFRMPELNRNVRE